MFADTHYLVPSRVGPFANRLGNAEFTRVSEKDLSAGRTLQQWKGAMRSEGRHSVDQKARLNPKREVARVGGGQILNVFEVKWHRVVLDEGHYISNYKSTTSTRNTQIHLEHRLLPVLGFPVLNCLCKVYAKALKKRTEDGRVFNWDPKKVAPATPLSPRECYSTPYDMTGNATVGRHNMLQGLYQYSCHLSAHSSIPRQPHEFDWQITGF